MRYCHDEPCSEFAHVLGLECEQVSETTLIGAVNRHSVSGSYIDPFFIEKLDETMENIGYSNKSLPLYWM
jgi:hypothetical protein